MMAGIRAPDADEHPCTQQPRLRELRTARQWSQEQLARQSGPNLRTIQRLESGAKISMESLRALAAVFEVPVESLLAGEPNPRPSVLQAMREGVLRALKFTGVAPCAEFWWFALAVAVVLAFAQLLADAIGPLPLQLATLAVLQPWIVACATPASAPGGS